MTATHTVQPQTTSSGIPAVPLTIEGYSVLHQMMRFRWERWRDVPSAEKERFIAEASSLLGKLEQGPAGQSALFSLLGHKGDLMLVHFRESFDALKQAELQLAQLRLSDYLEATTSYLSVIELGFTNPRLRPTKSWPNAALRRIRRNGIEQSPRRSYARKKRCARGFSRRFPSIATFAFTPWTGGAAKKKTGIWCRWKSVRGR